MKQKWVDISDCITFNIMAGSESGCCVQVLHDGFNIGLLNRSEQDELDMGYLLTWTCNNEFRVEQKQEVPE